MIGSRSRAAALSAAAASLLSLSALVGPLHVGAASSGRAPSRTAAAAPLPAARPPLIFGHRGASGYRPEHTLASYDMAVRLGADVIEPDLVSTKDHQLVARHENDITGTTDVALHPEFANRKTTKVVDGVTITGWFTEDFTLRELETLWAVERLPAVRQENTALNKRYRIATLQQVIDLARLDSAVYRRRIGIAPETKHPTYFDGIGLSLEEPLVRTLRANGLDRPDSMVYLQSFETANLRELRTKFHLRVHLLQLTSTGPTALPYDHVASGNPQTYAQMQTPAGLRQIATYADVLGPDKAQIFPRDADGRSLPATSLVSDAHRAGLSVVPYTVRPENQFLPLQLRSGTNATDYGHVFAEYSALFRAGIDGLFSDTPDLELAAREDYWGYRYTIAHPEAVARVP